MLREEIKNCMAALDVNGEHFDASFTFPPDFTGFSGHFPNSPVLPGVCTIQAVLVAFQAWKQQPVKLVEIANAKFFAPVAPGDQLVFACQTNGNGSGPAVVKARISNNGTKIAQISLKVACTGPAETDG